MDTDNDTDNDNDKMNSHIKKIYSKLSYLDNYSTQVILVIVLIFGLIVICTYCYVQMNIEAVKADWANQRCKPGIIPFAGYINKLDPTMTANESTKQNMEYCTQNTLKTVAADAVQPITFALNNLTTISNQTTDAINSGRGMFDKIRTSVQSVSTEIMGRILNVVIPIQQIFISFKDLMAKVQGVMASALFTSLGTYYTLKSLLGAIVEFLIKILVALAVMVVIMWLTPFTWGVASTMTAVFIAVSIPLALILTFMTDVLHIKSDMSIPSVPKRPSCFDENTLIQVIRENENREELSFVPIKNIQIGDKLIDGGIITAKMKLLARNHIMYNLGGVIVSESHSVKYIENTHNTHNTHNQTYSQISSKLIPKLIPKTKWIHINEHPDAIKITEPYNNPFIYCINTTTKNICIKNLVFCDWDELILDEQKNILCNKICKNNVKIMDDLGVSLGLTIHKYIDTGFAKYTNIQLPDNTQKEISKIEPGDKVIGKNGQITVAYGIVEIKADDLNNPIFVSGIKQNKLYHLLTCDACFCIKNNKPPSLLNSLSSLTFLSPLEFLKNNYIQINDYNSLVDFYA